jgi:hypothetical protein
LDSVRVATCVNGGVGQQIADFSQVFRDSYHALVRLLRYTRLNSVRVMVSPG